MNNFFTENRKLFAEKLDNNSIAIFFAGNAPIKRGDEKYPFSPDRNVYYLTGCSDENFILFIEKGTDETKEKLFITPYDENKAKWVGGVRLPEEYTALTGIEDISYLYDFEEFVSNEIFSKRTNAVYLDLENRYFSQNSPSLAFAEKLAKNYPHIPVKDAYPILAQMRTVKKEFEIANIRKAIEITKEGIYEMMRHAKPEMYEYEIEAYFSFILAKNGVKHKAFESIAASGKNAAILHYSENNSQTHEDDLILCDVGASYGFYSGDITRTFPVSGKFTPRSRQIYEIVLGGQKKVISSIKPSLPFKRLNEILKEYYAAELKKIGLINSAEEVSKYYYHGVSHLLGLETHDAGRHNEGELCEGMVFTVEPGLYIAEEGIGIRIEDDVLVTKDGCEVLSSDIIKEADDIEKFMSGAYI